MSNVSAESTESNDDVEIILSPQPTTASKTNSRPKREIPAPVSKVEEEYGGRESRRTRRRTSRFEFDGLDNEEQKLLQQAIKNSKKETKRVECTIPMAPTYYPSAEEWRDPFQYIAKIRPDAEQYGICKVVPPAEWNPPCLIDMHSPKLFPTRRQAIHTLQEGERGFDDGKEYDIASYKLMADAFAKQWSEDHYAGQDVPLELLAKDYWDCVETGTRKIEVEYGNDLDTSQYQSGFHPKLSELSGIETGPREEMFTEEYYKRTGWNLNNIAATDGSVLKYLKTDINGVNVPWLYVGMMFTSFCWHNEDNYLYSINYNHMGAIKQWYGVPGEQAKNFDKVAKDFLWESFQESPDLLHHMTTQISPSLLASNNIPICQARHEPRTFLITFPKAYHCGFSYGFNVGEAVNFATSDWLTYGSDADERYRKLARQSVFSHQRLLFTLLNHKRSLAMMERPQFLLELTNEILKVLDEEIESRPYIFQNGIRDISDKVLLPPNSFDAIDSTAAEYDDMRGCYLCKHICVFSAIACECDRTKVVCIRHYHLLCSCAQEKKYLLEWASTKDLKALRSQLRQALHELSQQTKKLNRDRGSHGHMMGLGQPLTQPPTQTHRQPHSGQLSPTVASAAVGVTATSSSASLSSNNNNNNNNNGSHNNNITTSSSSSNNNSTTTSTTTTTTNNNNISSPSPTLAQSNPQSNHTDGQPPSSLEVKPTPCTDGEPVIPVTVETNNTAGLKVSNGQGGVEIDLSTH